MSVAEWEVGLLSHQCFNALLFSQSQNSASLVCSVSAIISQVSWLLEVWASNRNISHCCLKFGFPLGVTAEDTSPSKQGIVTGAGRALLATRCIPVNQ